MGWLTATPVRGKDFGYCLPPNRPRLDLRRNKISAELAEKLASLPKVLAGGQQVAAPEPDDDEHYDETME